MKERKWLLMGAAFLCLVLFLGVFRVQTIAAFTRMKDWENVVKVEIIRHRAEDASVLHLQENDGIAAVAAIMEETKCKFDGIYFSAIRFQGTAAEWKVYNVTFFGENDAVLGRFTAAQDGSVYIDGRKYVLTNDYEKETVADFLDGVIEKYRQQVKVL